MQDLTPSRRRLLELWAPVVLIPPALLVDAAIDDKDLPFTWWRVLLVVLACVPLVLRKRLGFFALAPVVTAGVVLALFAIEPGQTVTLIPMVALYELAARGTRRRTVWASITVVPFVVAGVLPFSDSPQEFLEVVIRQIALCELALASGEVVRGRREAAAAREAQAVDDERLRLAREIHDTVAHAMVAINVQAGVAAHLLERDPEHARSALLEIKAASGAALADLRGTLGVLRGGEAAPTRPAARLADLDELTSGLRAAGVAVEVADLPAVPEHLETTIYRIVQEALTNVLRHATATTVRVAVTADGETVVVEIVDDGAPKHGTAGAGQGVRGMRERAEALGGEVHAGPASDGGWRVRAWLPA